MFRRELMVTAFDVKYGKPHPEPYLMALQKGGLAPNEAIVVENAPMGVQAGAAAGIFTVAVNTGPIDGRLTGCRSKCIIPVYAGFLRQLGELT